METGDSPQAICCITVLPDKKSSPARLPRGQMTPAQLLHKREHLPPQHVLQQRQPAVVLHDVGDAGEHVGPEGGLRVPGAGPAQALPRGQVKELGRDGGGAKVHGGACAGARRKGKRGERAGGDAAADRRV